MNSKLHTFNQWLAEKVEYHKELCPKVWNGIQLDPEIRKKLILIAKDFWNSLKLGVQVVDVQLTGSLANYNWTNSSDLDVHIIIDFAQVDENIELVRKALDGQRFVWNQRHPVIIRGHDVECYLQHKDQQHTSTGLYSILKNDWVIKPNWNPPQVEDEDIKEKIRVLRSEFKEIKKKIKGAREDEAQRLFEYLKRFKKKIMNDRQEGLTRGGEFSVENLVFKELRRDGTIEDIINTMSTAYSNIYSE
jgi:hypothetical protein